MKTLKRILVLIVITIMLIIINGCEKPDETNQFPSKITNGTQYPKTDPNCLMEDLGK